MAQSPTSEPDSSKPSLSATGVLRAEPVNADFQTDFAQLAACFAAQSGGGLSPELSTDLALEIVLNEIVVQACLTTGATGAAIALKRNGEMICRGSSGATAPELGSRLDAASGLSGECIRTRRTQRCDDVLTNSRVDAEASQRLGVRSVMVMPVLREDELVGLFEVFSSLPHAFGERDERTIEALATRVLNNLDRAAQPLPQPPLQNEPAPASVNAPASEVEEIAPEFQQETPQEIIESSAPRGVSFVTWTLRVAVLACAVLLGVLLGVHPRRPRATVRPHSAVPPSAVGAAPAAVSPPVAANTVAKQEVANAVAQPSNSAKSHEKTVPPGGLLVFENGKEIFRMPPNGTLQNATSQKRNPQNEATSSSSGLGSGLERASSAEPDEEVVEFSAAAAQDGLLHRVEPEYPEAALEQKIQGAVVLSVHIGQNGAVQDVQIISGAPQLAQASTDAVMQWRFKPRLVKGTAVPMQTRVTLNFKLPQ
jgi:TonB family protein